MTKARAGTHESLSRKEEIKGPSDRSFGLTFAVIFALFAGISLWRGGTWWPYLGVAAAAFSGLALVRAEMLAPLNRLWLKFGLLLHKVMTPLVMGLMFYGVFTPMGLILKAMGKDLLRLKSGENASTYWIEREPPGPEPDTMPNQF